MVKALAEMSAQVKALEKKNADLEELKEEHQMQYEELVNQLEQACTTHVLRSGEIVDNKVGLNTISFNNALQEVEEEQDIASNQEEDAPQARKIILFNVFNDIPSPVYSFDDHGLFVNETNASSEMSMFEQVQGSLETIFEKDLHTDVQENCVVEENNALLDNF